MFIKKRKQLSNRPRGARTRRKRASAPTTLVFTLIIAAAALFLGLTIMLVVLSRTTTTTTSTTTLSNVRRANNTITETSTFTVVQHHDEQKHHDSSSLLSSSWPLIHIVNTRFMQDQGHLVTLAQARLYLFETFCFPTIIHQTSQHFVWIIKTDPNLDVNVRENLVKLLSPYPHYFLVASNVNFGIKEEEEGGGSWRDGSEGQDILFHSKIFTGNVTLLEQAHALRTNKPILETRLDADDGIHKLYLQYIQYSAFQTLGNSRNINWLYWCSRRHVEWHASPTKKEGLVQPMEHEKLCITPGITVGYSVGITKVPQYDHDVLYKEIQAHGGCHSNNEKDDDDDSSSENDNNMDCIQLVDDLSFVAVRARTPTSAGMKDVELEKEILDKQGIKLMWKAMNKLFFIEKSKAEETNAYILENVQQIAKENLEGQCTKGHSCKNSSAVLLQKLIQGDSGGETV